jgi:hypothetical protein
VAIPTLSFRERGAAFQSITLDRLIASRALIQANSGGGKSRALRYLAEQTHGQVQQFILDPEGEFSSLREKFDYVLAGKDGDVPADPASAKLLCRRLMELGASAVIDLYDLKLPDRRRFVRLFLEELMHLPRTLWRPLLVVVDEAHVFAPERASGDSEATDAVITLATQGRKRGYALVAATQRLSKLHKDVAAELLNKLIGRTGLDVDVKRAGDELGMGKDERLTLRQLAPGTFYAYGPAIANEVTLVRTGSVQTSHPEAGKIGAPAPPAPKAIQKLLSELKDLPAQAKEEARTVDDLQRELRDTRAQLRKLERGTPERLIEKPVVDQAAIQRAVDRALASQRKEFEKRTGTVLRLVKKATASTSRIKALVDTEIDPDLKDAIAQLGAPAIAPEISYPKEPERLRPTPGELPSRPAAISVRAEDSNGSLSTPERKILNALALGERLGMAPLERRVLAFFAGYTEGGHFNNVVGKLNTTGRVAYPSGGLVELTEGGRALTDPEAAPIQSIDDLHRTLFAKLGGPQQKILQVLIDSWPNPVSREELAERAGYTTGGHFNNTVGSLRTMGVADYPDKGTVVATAVLFPEGLS